MFCLAAIGVSCPHPMEASLAAFRWSSSSARGNTKPRLASATAKHLCGEAQKEGFRASASWRTSSVAMTHGCKKYKKKCGSGDYLKTITLSCTVAACFYNSYLT